VSLGTDRKSPLHFGLGAIAFFAAFGLARLESFDTLLALVKLATAAALLTAIGRASARWLGLTRGGPLAAARDLLLGQLVATGYVYARSLLSDTLGVPGLSMPECFAAAALLWFTGERRDRPELAQAPPRPVSLALIALWVSWLAWIAIQKLDLHFTPSSDPDIHAFYARAFIERGQIYYDLLPGSDAWMVYPSAFMTLNFVWGVFSGLHPVQLVNLAPHIQWTLFAGATFACFARHARSTSSLLPLAALHFGFAYLGFNAVFAEGRLFLEGTPRLAHTALLVHPLLLAVENREPLRARPALWALPLLGSAVGACVNPTHVPAVSMVLLAALACVAPRERLVIPGALALAIGLAIAFTDPFYRGLVEQRSASNPTLSEAPDLSGRAFGGEIDLSRVGSHGFPPLWQRWASGDAEAPAAASGRRLFGLAGLGVWVWMWRQRRGNPAAASGPTRAEAARSSFHASFAALVSVGLIHALWTALTPALSRPGVLQTRLLVQYSRALQEQIELMILAIVPLALTTLMLAGQSGAASRRTALVVLLVALFGIAPLAGVQLDNAYPALRTSPLGEVQAEDVDFARRAVAHVPQEERILLPGRRRRIPDEHWVFTIDAGRAVPLFTDARTSFFLGLDGWSFTADHYAAHVEPPHFDPLWLREHAVLWIFDSGQFSRRFLERHYERALQGARASLWRLREPGTDGSLTPTATTFGAGSTAARTRRPHSVREPRDRS